MTRALVLMAGGYPMLALPKHKLKDAVTGKYLFEAIIDNIPSDVVWIIHNQIFQGFWNNWYFKTAYGSGRNVSLFLDKQNPIGNINNPSLWVTSGAASLAMNHQIDEVVISPIDLYFGMDFNFVDELLKSQNAVVMKADGGFSGMFKTTTTLLLTNGQLTHGKIGDVTARMVQRGTDFKVIKTSAIDVGTEQNLQIAPKGSIVIEK
jgi:hypothetical protein